MEETGGKSVRMLLPIKTQNGFIEKRIIEEDSKISNKEGNESINDKSQKENKEENSDTEVDMDTPVRFNICILVSET